MILPYLKQRLLRRKKQVGCILLLPSPDVAEIIAHSGVDVVMIDHEHGGGTLGDFIAQDRALSAHEIAAMVRLPHGELSYAQRLLDSGARALVYPGVDSAAQAEAFVHACRYPPRGTRGAGSGTRASSYGLDSNYFTPEIEDETLLVVQIESALAVENIDAIASVAGVDMLLIGPRDLSASIGALGDFNNPELWRLVDQAAERVRAHGKFLASTLRPGHSINKMFANGYDVVLAGKDVDFLLDGGRALVESAR